jgi:hypothetical protein
LRTCSQLCYLSAAVVPRRQHCTRTRTRGRRRACEIDKPILLFRYFSDWTQLRHAVRGRPVQKSPDLESKTLLILVHCARAASPRLPPLKHKKKKHHGQYRTHSLHPFFTPNLSGTGSVALKQPTPSSTQAPSLVKVLKHRHALI